MANCVKYEINDATDELSIWVVVRGRDDYVNGPFKNGNYRFSIVCSDASLGVPPIVITVPILFGALPPRVETMRLLSSNGEYSNGNWLAGQARPTVAIAGDPNTGLATMQNQSISPGIFANGVTGFKVSVGKISPVLKQKLLAEYPTLQQCDPNNPSTFDNSSSVSISFAADTSTLPPDAAVTLLDPTISASLCGPWIGDTCDAPFEKYMTVLFTPPPAVARDNGNDWGGWIDGLTDTIDEDDLVDDTGGAPDNGGSVYPGPGGIGGATPPTAPIGPIIVADPNPIEFDDTDVGTVRTKTFRLLNIGDQPASITGMASTLLSEPFFFGFNNNYPFTLLPGQSITGTVAFAPPSAATFEDFCQVTMDLQGADVVICEVLVTGTGVTSGDPGETKFKGIAIYGDTSLTTDLNFGNQGINDGPKSAFITVVNTGNDPDGLTISNATIIGTDAGQFATAIPGGSVTIPFGGIYLVEVQYDPTATGDHTSQFRITSDADEGTDDPINGYNFADVFGTGTLFTPTRILDIEGGSNFGEVVAGNTEELSITLTNDGNSPIFVRGVFSPDPFTLNLESLGLGIINPTVFTQSVINGVVYPTVYSYVFPAAYRLNADVTSPGIIIIFTPPSVDTYSGTIGFDLTEALTFGETTWFVSGVGIFPPIPPPEPEPEPEPDPEPGPDPGVDPPPNPLSPTCIQKSCEIPYIYDYSVNEPNLT